MAVPTITIGTPSRTKISSITGYDQATVTFQSDVALQSWEARATTEGQETGHGVGLLVESGGSLAANTDATVYVDDEELTSGDLEYTITVFGHGTDGYWSDGSYEAINILDMTDENIVYLDEYMSYSNNVLTIDTGTLNTDINGYAMKVQILNDDWSYYEQLMYDKETGTKSVNITKTSSFTTIRVALNGDVVDAAFSIDADALLQNGDSYVLSFDVLEISMNRAVLSNISLVKAVV